MSPDSGRSGPSLLKEGKIIRREEAACWQTAQQCLALAQEQAQQILAAAAEQEAQAEGKGYATGIAQARAEQSHIIDDMLIRRDNYLADIETALVGVVMNAVRKIFAEFDDAERTRIVVGMALRTLRNQTQATVRVHPSQYGAVLEAVNSLIKLCPKLTSLAVESDSRVHPAACILSSDIGIIETDIDTQIRAIELSLTHAAIDSHGTPGPNATTGRGS